ncbi:hypothetical protein [Arsenophonus endosymbiont of Bemisia tabaci]|uniref:hypothetical protein n=1 Tax=Arsenophonus endosymbiont of Bemisia tabaci TaxID=536059 RepID=UPI0015F53640|nr:hypothetical protein [Arsenophonus endosymbiont of Bemisia tabaci]CAA2930750.1 hypothetical protein ARSQ2_01887 [Arsenophonus endosymbiont of Bemisia tabaci Q2]
MRDEFAPQLILLYENIGLKSPVNFNQIDFSIRVDEKFSVRLIEYPVGRLVTCTILQNISQEKIIDLMKYNLISHQLYQAVLAISDDKQLVIWQGLRDIVFSEKI